MAGLPEPAHVAVKPGCHCRAFYETVHGLGFEASSAFSLKARLEGEDSTKTNTREAVTLANLFCPEHLPIETTFLGG